MPEKYVQSSFLMDMAKYVYAILLFFRKLNKKRSLSFTYSDKVLSYFEHPYNGTWMNERAVEIPLAWAEIQGHLPDQVLEVGNVLSHYFDIRHTVIDKYENRPNVISKDIIDVGNDRKYDIIISISTIEHVGWDELPRYPKKCVVAIKKMQELLTSNGKLFVTFPLGYNLFLDKLLFAEKLECNHVFYFRRLNRYEWTQAEKRDVVNSTYGKKYRSTDGLAICIWNKLSEEL